MSSAESSSTQRRIFRSKWVCPVDQPPIENGAVVVSENRIQEVGKFKSISHDSDNVIDLGQGALIPGLVNAHTHLEFSNIETPLGHPGIRFTDWIRLIVSCRNKANQDDTNQGDTNHSNKMQRIKRGIEESVRAGVSAIGEIATAPFRVEDYSSDSPICLVTFLEQLGRDVDSFPDKRIELDAHFSLKGENEGHTFCASPHAPYSVHPELLKQICEQARTQNRSVAMHIAETIAERELLEHRTGDFVELLKDFGVWNPETFASGCSILETLQTLSQVSNVLLIHGNYLSDIELNFIASQSKTMSVVFCPRTHRFFGHSKYPLEKLRKRNINVAVGTDSRASNPDLDLFEELKLIADSFPGIGIGQILKMGTFNGAKALGCERKLGSISIGKEAAFSFIESDASSTDASLERWIFSPESICRPVH